MPCRAYDNIVLIFAVIPQSQIFNLASLKHVSRETMRTLTCTIKSEATSTTQENVLEWVKSDNRRVLHVVYRVGDLDRTIKYVIFLFVYLSS